MVIDRYGISSLVAKEMMERLWYFTNPGNWSQSNQGLGYNKEGKDGKNVFGRDSSSHGESMAWMKLNVVVIPVCHPMCACDCVLACSILFQCY